MTHRNRLQCWTASMLLVLTGCEGAVDGEGAAGPRGASCELPSPGRAPMRRLTPYEIDRSLTELFGRPFDVASRVLPTERVGGYTTSVDVGAVTELWVEQYQALAEDVAADVGSDLPALFPCSLDEGDGSACVASFLDGFGARVFRRPLEAEERSRLLGFYVALRSTQTAEESARRLIEVLLQSPRFLYRIELPTEGASVGAVRPLDDYEMASRLSFLVWAQTPDDALLAAARSGELATPEGRTEALDRLLEDPRAAAVVSQFVDEWMELERLESLTKDEDAYPDYDPSLAPLFREETLRFVEAAWQEDGASIDTLLGADWSIRNEALAAFYDEGSTTGAGWERVTLPAHRRGLLGHASFLASYAKPADTSPTRRGMFIRGRLLCGVVESPPPDVVTEVPDPDPTLTLRERLSEHRVNPGCASCHTLMDPIGLGLESFDGIGHYRTMERGSPIDATGNIYYSDVEGAFDGSLELTERLASSADVERCFARQYFRFAMGRTENLEGEDRCALSDMRRELRSGERSIRDLLAGLVRSRAFTHIAVPSGVDATGGGL
jgi:hypothetical protein